MKMQHKVLTAALAVALCGLAGSASADQFSGTDGTINITGSVIAQTCSVNGGSGDKTVVLPSVLQTAMPNAGDTAGNQAFTIDVTGCDDALNGKTVDVDFSGSNINAQGRLDNTAVGGSNVEVQILNDSDTAIVLNDGGADTGQDAAGTLAAGAVTFNYSAQYYAPAAATAGAVTTSVDFTLTYN